MIRVPENYEVIDFKIYLSRIFSSTNFFIDSERKSNFSKQLISKFENETTCFKKYGILKEVEFADIYFGNLIVCITTAHNLAQIVIVSCQQPS